MTLTVVQYKYTDRCTDFITIRYSQWHYSM